uniref:Uncharacterized protein n=1 Tax=Myoviridae sp. ct6Ob8 TaxID=2825035 RepID=A0A8S5PS59_9CAUD|nr:MAG TPA: hypothetical protein [Myoviridae sp. ct6Ob8]DAR93849.1 MAG TPA: hypothetical protein [Caudoviricetes sp.]
MLSKLSVRRLRRRLQVRPALNPRPGGELPHATKMTQRLSCFSRTGTLLPRLWL